MSNVNKYASIFLVAAAFIGMVNPSAILASADSFPIYDCIKPNVEFWKKVYSKYTTRQGIIHDNEDLNIIYEVIDLLDPEQPGARKINRTRIERAKNRVIDLLMELARGHAPTATEAKQVAALFGPKATGATFQKAIQRIRCQVGQKNRFREGLIRSGAYLPEIRAIFQRNGLPADLVYLPHVESSFNPDAYSKFGAAGIWQFTRSTGKRFMTISYTIDERRDPIRSSHAAVELLKENHDKLKDWPLAITAYNHGANGMLRAKKTKGAYDSIFQEYQSRMFQFASRNFYSEFLAAREIAKEYTKYFGDLSLEPPMRCAELVLTGFVAVNDLSRHLDIRVEEIRRLNPSLREPVYSGEKYIPEGFRLRLPANKGKNLSRAVAELSSDLLKSQQKPSLFHLVQKGETTGKIAKIHGVPLKALLLANNLGSQGTIYPGQNLRLPTTGNSGASRARAETSSTPPKNEAIPPKKPVPAPVVKAEAPEPEPEINPSVVRGDLQIKRVAIQKGMRIGVIQVEVEETLGHYAEWLRVPVREIQRINGLKNGAMLRLSQQIKVPLQRISKEQFEEKRFEYHEELVQDFFAAYRVEQIQTYHIKEGDNIWKLCQEVFEVPLWLFCTYNAGLDLNALKNGHPVRIPIIEKIDSSLSRQSSKPDLARTETEWPDF